MTVQSYFPFQDRGGPVFKVRALARGLAHRGHQVTVLTANLGFSKRNESGIKAVPSQWGWRGEEDGVEAIYLSTFGHIRALTLNPGVIGFCRAHLRQFDLVHFYGLYDLMGPAVSYFCRRQWIPYVVEPMGMYRPIVRNLLLKRMYHRLLGRRLVRAARYLIATSAQEKQELVECGLNESLIVVRRNGIEIPDQFPTHGLFRHKWGIPLEAKLVLYLGRLVSKKSPDLLLEAFSRWRRSGRQKGPSILVLAGPEEHDGYLQKLKAIASHLGLSNDVLFPGPLFGQEKWAAYRDADIFVLPSQNENFGNTAAESAACGTPVIVTKGCGIATFVGEAGLVVAHDTAELEHALEKLLEDSSLLKRCQEGCGVMTQALSWDHPLDQTEGLYRQCISEAMPR